jgi:nitrogen fixation protein NifX
VAEVLIGDLEDFEHLAQAAGCDLLMTHSHGRQAAQRLGKPLFRIGIPMFDRVGNAHICHVGYRGTRNFVYEVGNLLMDQIAHHGPTTGRCRRRRAPLRPVHVPAVIARLPKPARSWPRPAPDPRRPPPRSQTMKVAFATQDQQRVDAHFGWAKHLAVYDVTRHRLPFVQDFGFGEDLAEDGDEDKLAPKLDAIATAPSSTWRPSAARRRRAWWPAKIHPIKVTAARTHPRHPGQAAGVLAGTPPPWLRKALLKGQARASTSKATTR